MTTLNYRFVVRRGLAADWTSQNKVLLQGEFGLETDTKRTKLGDGVNAWNSLPYHIVSQTITNGEVGTSPSEDTVYDALLMKQNLPTGFVQGWQLSIDPADNTKFRIDVGAGIFTDFTTIPDVVAVIRQTLSMQSGITPTYLATKPSSYIAFDVDLNIIQSDTPFTNADRRVLCILGNVVHSNNTIINAVNEIKAPIIAPTNQLHDFMIAVGRLILDGNAITANGSNLSINVSSGTRWGMGINSQNYMNPHQLTSTSRTAPTFSYRLRDSTQYAASAFLDPTSYDNNGVKTVLSNNNRWSIHRINDFQSDVVVAQYGQAEYSTYQDAVNALLTEPFVVEKNIKDNGYFLARIIMKKTCTDLAADIAAGIASIHITDKFGGSATATATTATAIIAALGYTPANQTDMNVALNEFINQQTGTTYTYLTDDRNKLVIHSNGSSIAAALPQAGASFPSGWWMDVRNVGTGTLTITPTTSTIDGSSSLVLTTGQGVRIVSDGTNYFLMRDRLPSGTDGQILQLVSGTPTWVNSTSGLDFEQSTWSFNDIDNASATGEGGFIPSIYLNGTNTSNINVTGMFGCIRQNSGASTNSGAFILSGATVFAYAGAMVRVVFLIESSQSGRLSRLGFIAAGAYQAAETNGVFVELNDQTATAVCVRAGSGTTTQGSATLPLNTILIADIEWLTTSSARLVVFEKASLTKHLDETISTNTPTSGVFQGAKSTASSTNTPLMVVDYIGGGRKRPPYVVTPA